MSKSNHVAGLGDKVKCKITGFTGVVTTVSHHLAGCDRLWVTPPVDKDGKVVDGCWQDVDMLEIVEAGVLSTVTYKRETPGGVDLPSPK